MGAAAATGLVALTRPTPLTLGLFVVLATYTCFMIVRVNYAMFACVITVYVVCLLAIAGLPEPEVAVRRAGATIIGGALAIAAHLIAITFRQARRAALAR